MSAEATTKEAWRTLCRLEELPEGESRGFDAPPGGFTGLFAMMYASGITIIDALRAAEDVVGNTALKAGLQQAGRRIEQGAGLSEAFAGVELFPPLVTRMLRVGESTGALDQALSNVSYFYERDVREAIERLQASIEPALTVILGLLLLAVMSAVMLPIYDIVSRMKL